MHFGPEVKSIYFVTNPYEGIACLSLYPAVFTFPTVRLVPIRADCTHGQLTHWSPRSQLNTKLAGNLSATQPCVLLI